MAPSVIKLQNELLTHNSFPKCLWEFYHPQLTALWWCSKDNYYLLPDHISTVSKGFYCCIFVYSSKKWQFWSFSWIYSDGGTRQKLGEYHSPLPLFLYNTIVSKTIYFWILGILLHFRLIQIYVCWVGGISQNFEA